MTLAERIAARFKAAYAPGDKEVHVALSFLHRRVHEHRTGDNAIEGFIKDLGEIGHDEQPKVRKFAQAWEQIKDHENVAYDLLMELMNDFGG